MGFNRGVKQIQLIDLYRETILLPGKVIEELRLAHTGDVMELLPKVIGMAFDNLGNEEGADYLLHWG